MSLGRRSLPDLRLSVAQLAADSAHSETARDDAAQCLDGGLADLQVVLAGASPARKNKTEHVCICICFKLGPKMVNPVASTATPNKKTRTNAAVFRPLNG